MIEVYDKLLKFICNNKIKKSGKLEIEQGPQL
jgi:hypothetical protein